MEVSFPPPDNDKDVLHNYRIDLLFRGTWTPWTLWTTTVLFICPIWLATWPCSAILLLYFPGHTNCPPYGVVAFDYQSHCHLAWLELIPSGAQVRAKLAYSATISGAPGPWGRQITI